MSDMILCDVCGRPLAVGVGYYKDFGLESTDDLDDGEFEYIGMYRTKEWNTRDLFPNLCETCACCIDQALRKMKTDMCHREAMLLKYKALNMERRERLGIKG